jgi:hypothetical protein
MQRQRLSACESCLHKGSGQGTVKNLFGKFKGVKLSMAKSFDFGTVENW